jgi:hypothetical protein
MTRTTHQPLLPTRTLASRQTTPVWVVDIDNSVPELVYSTEELLLEAPSWAPDGTGLLLNGDGLLGDRSRHGRAALLASGSAHRADRDRGHQGLHDDVDPAVPRRPSAAAVLGRAGDSGTPLPSIGWTTTPRSSGDRRRSTSDVRVSAPWQT